MPNSEHIREGKRRRYAEMKLLGYAQLPVRLRPQEYDKLCKLARANKKTLAGMFRWLLHKEEA